MEVELAIFTAEMCYNCAVLVKTATAVKARLPHQYPVHVTVLDAKGVTGVIYEVGPHQKFTILVRFSQ